MRQSWQPIAPFERDAMIHMPIVGYKRKSFATKASIGVWHLNRCSAGGGVS